MKGTVVRRILLAFIPVAMLATASLALTGVTQQPVQIALMPAAEQPVQTTGETPPAVPPAATTSTNNTAAPQSGQTVNPGQTGQPTEPTQQTTEQAQPPEPEVEPLPELVVDTTPLTQAMMDIDKALEQAKLAVTALDAPSQQRYIQEAINLLAGSTDASFRLLAAGVNAESYRGVRPLLIQARVTREAAEVQWIAAVQRQLEARARKLAEIAQAGNAAGTVVPPPVNNDISSTVGPTGVLGTRGVRVEEQATELVSRALRQATEALRLVPARSQSSTPEGDALSQNTDQASQMMESAVRMLESAKKIIQIAIER